MKDNKHIKTFEQHVENLNSELSKDSSSSLKDKRLVFSDFVVDLFKTKYQHLFNNNDEDIIDKFEYECKEKAKQLGMDVDNLSMDGELIFNNDEDYKKSEKNFWWDYYDKEICVYRWK
jgi:hypothetical protein